MPTAQLDHAPTSSRPPRPLPRPRVGEGEAAVVITAIAAVTVPAVLERPVPAVLTALVAGACMLLRGRAAELLSVLTGGC
ncbi:hypothetical protein [Streptomyces sp. NPDC093591]|uniref:hypothetical protein n=1 Tax=Streptomyces sp. NPDC093591 TaxID=3366044 RepID=UPI0037F1497A